MWLPATLTEYDAVSGLVRGRISDNNPPAYWMAIDSHGTLYVPTGSRGIPGIQQYGQGNLTPKVEILDGVVAPRTIIIDRYDTLYLANVGTESSIQIYPYGSTKPIRAIDRGIGVPEDIAVGEDNTLYVAATQGWSVMEYNASNGQLLRNISESGEPQRLALSPSGLLAVQCDDNNGSNFVDLYAYRSGKRLTRIVPHPGARFGSMAFDNRDALYIGEEFLPKSDRTYTEIEQYSASGQRRRELGSEDGVVNFVLK